MAGDIRAWLSGLGLVEFAEAFEENGVDWSLLPDVNNDDLKDMGVARVADRKRILKAIALLDTEFEAGVAVHPAADLSTLPGSFGPERRQVTILFADISGYTKLSTEVDAEKIHEILGRYFDSVDTTVVDHGGSVDKHIGDSVMAIFGAPVAHSDDPARAVRAALAIHESMPEISKEIGHQLRVHIGIASGQVVASGIGSDAHYTVTGESVNLASRLTDAAGTGETLVSKAIHDAVPDLVEWQDRGTYSVKGFADEIQGYAVLGFRKERAKEGERPFVGRLAEVQQFMAAMTACVETGLGQTIYIRGEAGIGKTRLCEKFQEMALESGFAAHRTLVLDFGVGKGQDAIRSVVRSLLSLPAGSSKADRAAAAERALAKGLLDQTQMIHLNDLLDLPQPLQYRSLYDAMDNERRNQGKRETVSALVRGLGYRQPLFILVEDIHWASSLILAHLAELARTAAEQPIILVMTSRIEGDPLNQVWRISAGATSLTTIDLGPLRHDDAMALAESYFEASSRHALKCVERAEGNPLFLEQLLRTAENAAEDQVPGSVQSIVQSRVDTLEYHDKRALQVASVLGQRFALDAVRHLIANPQYTCKHLIGRHLVRPEGEQYLFAHALVREGVYNSMLTAHRRDLHRSAAAWYKDFDLGLRAEHLDRAGDPEASSAYLEAAQAQADAFHFETALGLTDRGIELAGSSDVSCDLTCLRGDALRNLGATEDSIEAFEAALQSAPDDVRACRAQIGMAEGLRVADRQELGLKILEQAEMAAAREDLLSERAQIHRLRGNLYFPLGNMDGCLKEHEKALSLAREAGSAESEALAHSGLGDAYYLRGHMRSSCEQFRACVALCHEHGYGRIEVANRHMVGWTRMYLMEFHEALEDALAAVEMAAEVSHQRAETLGLMLAGFVELELGRFADARNHLEHGLDLARTLGAGNFEANILYLLAHLEHAQGRLEQARDVAQQGIAVIRDVGVTFMGPSVLSVWAAVTDDADERRKALAEAEAIMDTGCVAHNYLRFALTAIDLSLTEGAWAEVDRYADRLELSTREQALPWPDFVIARGRALAAWGRGERKNDLVTEIRRLHDLAINHGLGLAAPGLESALAEVQGGRLGL